MPRTCPQCGKSLPDHLPLHLCPTCLLAGSPEVTVESGQEAESTEAATQESFGAPAPPLHGQFEPGAILADRYRIVSLLGKGGMGEVYRADDLTLKEPVALKILPAKLGSRPGVLEALRNEVKQARQVSHRHVCRVHDIGEIDGKPLVSMEFIEGEDLASLLRRIGRLPSDKAMELASQLASGMSAAHEEGVLHLDLKPANLMIDRNGKVKISDFGLARLASRANEDNRIAGTPAYMAPEQVLEGRVSAQSDIYAFGLILHEMCTGERAYPAAKLEDVRSYHSREEAPAAPSSRFPGLDQKVERLILDCLERDAEKRPATFSELVERLSALSSGPDSKPDVASGEPSDSTIDESDIYLSYAPIDNRPLSPDRKGWITQFHRNLEIRVEQLSGRHVRVFLPPRGDSSEEPDTEVLTHLPEMKALVSVVSPPFVHSEGCLREVESFWDSNMKDGRLYVDGHTRVLKVMKTPVDTEDFPGPLRDRLQELLGFEFFDYDPETGRLREYSECYGAEAEQRFHERIYDLAQEINGILKAMGRTESTPIANGKTVYLASTTSDIAPLRDRIRRELIGRGHRVVPEKPLPLVASEAESLIRNSLAECDLSIHPFGRSYGIIPEGSELSLAALQNELAAEHSKETGLPRVIWIPNEVVAADSRQEKLLSDLKTEPSFHRNAEIVINTFQMLKPIVLDKLKPSDPALTGGEDKDPEAGSRPRRIYLICDSQDEEAIEPLEDHLFEQGFDLTLPDFEADEAEAAEMHRENLRDCDAVIIFYGAARNSWVDVKLRNILKTSGYGREDELAFNAVYIAPPFDRRKERYRTHSAEIIRQEAEFTPSLLQPLIARLRKG